MGKYIVELKKNETLYKATTRESDGTAYVCSAIGTPYVNPGLEQVREEAYQKGLSDAWEAVRKIYDISQEDRLEIFPEASTFVVADICDRYSASECVEKIRQYEQEKEEQIQVGDEVINQNKTAVVTEITNRYTRIMYSDGSGYALFAKGLTKTGRHFPEIAEVFAKMKETDNG